VLILLELSFIMDKKKRGIALLITMMVITSIMAIIAISFSYLDKVKKDAGVTSAIIQGNLLYSNSVDILKRFFPAGSNNSDKLKILYTMPMMLNESKSAFSLNLNCKPLMIGPPISWLNRDLTRRVPEKTELTKKVLQNIIEMYNIENPSQLEREIIQAVRGEHDGNEEFTPRITPQKGITSKAQFNRIITNYFLENDDKKVLTVPWEKYFSFTKGDNNRTKIDGKFLSAEFISVAFEIPIEIVQEWDRDQETLLTFLHNNGISDPLNKNIYAKKALNAMNCETTYAYRDRQYGFNFNYIEGRSSNFEFNGQK